jgi:hypothetical protein
MRKNGTTSARIPFAQGWWREPMTGPSRGNNHNRSYLMPLYPLPCAKRRRDVAYRATATPSKAP